MDPVPVPRDNSEDGMRWKKKRAGAIASALFFYSCGRWDLKSRKNSKTQ